MFAAPAAREPLLAVYALLAEWRALMDPATPTDAARIKLLWWRDEVQRLADGRPLHPISRHLAALPGAATAPWASLEATIDATAAQVAGAPLERDAELQAHAHALYGAPLLVAAQLSGPATDATRKCIEALAAADLLSRLVADYRREVRSGRVPFPVDALLAAGIDDADLAAATATPRLQAYLEHLRGAAARHYSASLARLPHAERPAMRHLLVLATLGADHLQRRRNPAASDFRPRDLYNAWNAARRAAAKR